MRDTAVAVIANVPAVLSTGVNRIACDSPPLRATYLVLTPPNVMTPGVVSMPSVVAAAAVTPVGTPVDVSSDSKVESGPKHIDTTFGRLL